MSTLNRENISGMTIDEYRKWMKDTCDEIHPKNSSVPLEMLMDAIDNVDTEFSAVNPDDYMGDMIINE